LHSHPLYLTTFHLTSRQSDTIKSFMKSILFIGALLFGTLAFAQDYDERLLAKFSEEQIIKLQDQKPDVLQYFSFYLDNGYKLVDPKPGKDYSQYPEIKLKNSSEINLFDLDIEHPLNSYGYYRIKNSDKILLLIPRSSLTKSYNKQS